MSGPRVDLTPVAMGDCTDMAPGWSLEHSPWTCRRTPCNHPAKANGGYCPCCFARQMAPHGDRPKVVVLCGSTRFTDAFREANLRLTMEGRIVLTVGCDTKSDADLGIAHELDDGSPTDIKFRLDELHKRKIDLADRVLVLNVGGYIGESTRSEIEYAEWFEKPIDYLESPRPATPEPEPESTEGEGR